MHLYLSQRPTHELQVAHILGTVSNLYRLNVLADSSRVWAQVGEFNNRVWALTNRSTCLQYLVANRPGCARITQERLRWGTTSERSQNSPDLEISFDDLPDPKARNLTLVIDHCGADDRTVSIIEKSASRDYSDGTYMSEETGVHIIDARAYHGAAIIWKGEGGQETYAKIPNAQSFYPDISEYDAAHATVYGVEFMTQNLTLAERTKAIRNPERFMLKLSHSTLNKLVTASYGNIEGISRTVIKELVER